MGSLEEVRKRFAPGAVRVRVEPVEVPAEPTAPPPREIVVDSVTDSLSSEDSVRLIVSREEWEGFRDDGLLQYPVSAFRGSGRIGSFVRVLPDVGDSPDASLGILGIVNRIKAGWVRISKVEEDLPIPVVPPTIRARRETAPDVKDEALISEAERACPWASFPDSCREWMGLHGRLTSTQRETLEDLISRADSGEFDHGRD